MTPQRVIEVFRLVVAAALTGSSPAEFARLLPDWQGSLTGSPPTREELAAVLAMSVGQVWEASLAIRCAHYGEPPIPVTNPL